MKSILAMFLCIAIIGMWAWSFAADSAWGWTQPARGAVGVELYSGALVLSWGPPADQTVCGWYSKGFYGGFVPERPLWSDTHNPLSHNWHGPSIPTNIRIIQRPSAPSPWQWDVGIKQWEQAGFAYDLGVTLDERDNGVVYAHQLRIPRWAASLVALGAAALFIRNYLRLRAVAMRSRQGLCRFCGYSLAGNESGVCPECGKAVQIPEPEPPGVLGQVLTPPDGRTLFTTGSITSLLLCVAVGIAFVATTRLTMYNPGPDITFHAMPGLGWTCVGLAGLTFLLFLKRGHEIRRTDERIRRGLCPKCGYDLRESHGKCPECGNDVE